MSVMILIVNCYPNQNASVAKGREEMPEEFPPLRLAQLLITIHHIDYI